jgi:SOS response regulatory protein OraA/RecX
MAEEWLKASKYATYEKRQAAQELANGGASKCRISGTLRALSPISL